jgi:hypothetical protein
MSSSLYASLFSLALLPQADPPGAEKQVRDIVQKATRAVGSLPNAHGLRWKETRTVLGSREAVQCYVAFPWRYRIRSEDQLGSRIDILDTDRGWEVTNGKVSAISSTQLERRKEYADLFRLWTMVPLIDEAAKIDFLGATRLNGRDVTQLKLRRKGLPDTTLSFDQSTGLLVRTLRTIKSVPPEGQLEEVVISRWANHGAYKFPAEYRYSLDQRVCGQARVSDCRPLAEIDATMFAEPAK